MSSVIVKVSGYLIMVRYVFDVFFLYVIVCVCVCYTKPTSCSSQRNTKHPILSTSCFCLEKSSKRNPSHQTHLRKCLPLLLMSFYPSLQGGVHVTPKMSDLSISVLFWWSFSYKGRIMPNFSNFSNPISILCFVAQSRTIKKHA